MFSTFPTKPIPHSPRIRQSRQAHRSAIIYEPNLNKLPARPLPVRTQPERPVPVIQLPGLPPRSVPKDIVKSDPKNWSEVSKKYESFSWLSMELTSSKSWLAQFLPFKKIREIAPPTYTPRTAKFVDAKKQHKGLADFDDTLEDDDLYDFKPSPPPLYIKEPPEGGLVGWLAVAGA